MKIRSVEVATDAMDARDFESEVARQLVMFLPSLTRVGLSNSLTSPGIEGDFFARSRGGAHLIFEVKYVPPGASFSFVLFPGLASRRDRVVEALAPRPAALIVMTNQLVPDPVRQLFQKDRIPLVVVDNNPSLTKERLRDGLKALELTVPELA